MVLIINDSPDSRVVLFQNDGHHCHDDPTATIAVGAFVPIEYDDSNQIKVTISTFIDGKGPGAGNRNVALILRPTMWRASVCSLMMRKETCASASEFTSFTNEFVFDNIRSCLLHREADRKQCQKETSSAKLNVNKPKWGWNPSMPVDSLLHRNRRNNRHHCRRDILEHRWLMLMMDNTMAPIGLSPNSSVGIGPLNTILRKASASPFGDANHSSPASE